MHSSTALSSDDFVIEIAGEPADVPALWPGFQEQSRLGVVVADDFGAVGASGLITATITAFYDILRAAHPEGFYRYADYYLFHIGRMRGNHNMLDVSPDHKEVLVAADGEQILRAVNDRGITHLVVPDGPLGTPDFEPQTENSAKSRLLGAMAYSPSGRTPDSDVEIWGCEQVDAYVCDTLEARRWADDLEAEGASAADIAWARSRQDEVPEDQARRMLAGRALLRVEGRTRESFRRVEVELALKMLAGTGVVGGASGS
jgi:hypothetical protein